jgi:hypothetical protein
MINPARPAVAELNRLVTDGIQTDIYLALESHGIFKTIGERTQAADASTYQPMLLALQSYASAIFILSITALLERQGQQHQLRSVHGVNRRAGWTPGGAATCCFGLHDAQNP